MQKTVIISGNFTRVDMMNSRDAMQKEINDILADESIKDFRISQSQSVDNGRTTLTIILSLFY